MEKEQRYRAAIVSDFDEYFIEHEHTKARVRRKVIELRDSLFDLLDSYYRIGCIKRWLNANDVMGLKTIEDAKIFYKNELAHRAKGFGMGIMGDTKDNCILVVNENERVSTQYVKRWEGGFSYSFESPCGSIPRKKVIKFMKKYLSKIAWKKQR